LYSYLLLFDYVYDWFKKGVQFFHFKKKIELDFGNKRKGNLQKIELPFYKTTISNNNKDVFNQP